MSRCSDSNLSQDKALRTFARNRPSCHRSTHVDRGWSMTLNFMPLVILFGLALLLVGRTNDQQTQQTAMNMSICVLAIRSGFSNRRSGLQTNQLCATGFRGGRRPQYESSGKQPKRTHGHFWKPPLGLQSTTPKSELALPIGGAGDAYLIVTLFNTSIFR
jgi:hypothetical protein